MPRQFSSFNFVALIAILLFSLMLIAAQPRGKFSSPAPPEIQSVSIQPNENVYVYGIGKIAQLDSTGAKYFHSDYLGTPRVETNANKNIVAQNNQYPFGEELSQQGAEKYTFTGKELDKSNLQYFGARFYDSSSGRFTQVDPVGAGYIYSNNNPLKFIDPTGNQAVETQASVEIENALAEINRRMAVLPPQQRVSCLILLCGFMLAAFGNPFFMQNQASPLGFGYPSPPDSLQMGEAASSLQPPQPEKPVGSETRAEQLLTLERAKELNYNRLRNPDIVERQQLVRVLVDIRTGNVIEMPIDIESHSEALKKILPAGTRLEDIVPATITLGGLGGDAGGVATVFTRGAGTITGIPSPNSNVDKAGEILTNYVKNLVSPDQIKITPWYD